MAEKTEKTESVTFAAENERLRSILKTASVQLRGGEDAQGIGNLISFVSEMGKLVDNDQNSQQPQIDLKPLLPAVKTLLFYIENQDIAGIADLLEDVFLPMTEEWKKGSDGA